MVGLWCKIKYGPDFVLLYTACAIDWSVRPKNLILRILYWFGMLKFTTNSKLGRFSCLMIYRIQILRQSVAIGAKLIVLEDDLATQFVIPKVRII